MIPAIMMPTIANTANARSFSWSTFIELQYKTFHFVECAIGHLKRIARSVLKLDFVAGVVNHRIF